MMENMQTETEIQNDDLITCDELRRYRLSRDIVEHVREELRQLAVELEAYEQDLIGRIEAGAAVEGEAAVITRRRQNIWLTAFKHRLGTSAVIAVKDSWPVSFYKELRVA